jgi:hypothetical protein
MTWTEVADRLAEARTTPAHSAAGRRYGETTAEYG